MVTAFVLINVEDKKLDDIGKAVLAYDGVKEVHVVAGEYDMVVVIRVKDNAELSRLLTESIIHTPGVHRTKTLISVKAHSHFDLEAIFQV
jgi:DNA-binding Lrp family transcriptional regulator